MQNARGTRAASVRRPSESVRQRTVGRPNTAGEYVNRYICLNAAAAQPVSVVLAGLDPVCAAAIHRLTTAANVDVRRSVGPAAQ